MTLPELLAPMEPTAVRHPFDDPDWLFQLKWDGVRMIAFCDRGSIRLQNRRLRDRTDAYLEIVAALRERELSAAVLDGEMVVLEDGRPSFQAVMRRDNCRPTPELVRSLPAAYVVFDLLYLEGQSLLQEPLAKRLELLRETVPSGDTVVVTDDHASGTALFAAVKAQGLEGIVAKRRGSRYRPGQKHPDWRKIKVFAEQIVPIIGYVTRRGQLVALVVRDPASGLFGRVGTGWTEADRRKCQQLLENEPAAGEPHLPVRRGEMLHPVRTLLAAEIRYAEWNATSGLRAPVIKRILEPRG